MDIEKVADLVLPNRRQQNKIQTREAIAAAAYSLFSAHGYDNITVAQVAEHAGVSRRTFFNYFTSIDDALQNYVSELLEIAIAVLDSLPTEYPLIEAAEIGIASLADRAVLGPLAELYAQSSKTPSLQSSTHASWALATEALNEKLIARIPNGDPFGLTVFSYTVTGAAKAAFVRWVPTAHDPINDEDINNLSVMLQAAMELVKDGFPSLEIIATTKGA